VLPDRAGTYPGDAGGVGRREEGKHGDTEDTEKRGEVL
jgi:hypothetical protein